VEEDWIVASTEPGIEACIVRNSLYQEFVKSTWLKSKIEKECYTGGALVFERWAKWAEGKL